MQSSAEMRPFSRWRAFIWPVYRSEYPKFVPLFLLGFLVGFNYGLLKIMKDSLVIVGCKAGAEVIPFLKVWGIVPGAVIITIIFGWLSRRYSRRAVFCIIIGSFLSFFFLFVTVLYPLGDAIHLHWLADHLQEVLPPGFRGFVSMIRYWSYSLYYIMSELWSSMVLSTLFWGLANEVTTISSAGRFYALINTGLNLSCIFSGEFSFWLSKKGGFVPSWLVMDPWHGVMLGITMVVVVAGLGMIGLYCRVYSLSQHLFNGKCLFVDSESESVSAVKARKKKTKVGAKNLFLSVIRSRYLLCIAIIVLSYNLVIHLCEVVWKDQVSQVYTSRIEFNEYMSRITTLTGITASLVSWLVLGQCVQKWGWTVGALLTPAIMLVSGVLFFGAIFANKAGLFVHSIFGITPLVMTAWIGGIQNILSRSAKFSFFDQTKEMAFVLLPPDEKNYGKAAIDGVVSRVGKSSGSLVYQGLLIVFSSVAASINVIAGVLLVVIVLWIATLLRLGREFAAKNITEGSEEASANDASLEEENPSIAAESV